MDTDRGRLRYASVLSLLIATALFLAARLIYLYISDPQRFPVNTVKIIASYQHVSHKQLETILDNYRNASFFSLPVRRLHTELLALEWVKKVQIERIWPDILKIALVEKMPIAVWNDGWLAENGEIFDKGGAKEDVSLPQLRGPANRQEEVLQVYQKISKILSVYGLQAATLEWRDNQAWELGLSNGVQLRLGKRELEMRVTRFCKAYPAVFGERPEQLASVDLRYPGGMAVQWKK